MTLHLEKRLKRGDQIRDADPWDEALPHKVPQIRIKALPMNHEDKQEVYASIQELKKNPQLHKREQLRNREREQEEDHPRDAQREGDDESLDVSPLLMSFRISRM